MRPISHCLNKQLLDICLKSTELDKLNSIVNQFLPDPLRNHCRIASFNKGCLNIAVDAPWATELRYSLPELRDMLRIEAKLYNLASIKITPAHELNLSKSSLKKSRTLSASTAKLIAASSLDCKFPPLQEALLRLSKGKL